MALIENVYFIATAPNGLFLCTGFYDYPQIGLKEAIRQYPRFKYSSDNIIIWYIMMSEKRSNCTKCVTGGAFIYIDSQLDE